MNQQIELEKITQLLKKKKLRVTKSRLAVAFFFLMYRRTTFTAEDIYHQIRSSQIYDSDQVSVYRALSVFEEIGFIIKTEFKGEAARYSFTNNDNVSCEEHDHLHYFKCRKCHEIEPLEFCYVSQKEQELSKKGYQDLQHHIEITGICPKCV